MPAAAIAARDAVTVILDERAPPGAIREAVTQLHDACTTLTGISDDDTAETTLDSGRALSPKDAGLCLNSEIRTVAFMRAAMAAVRQSVRSPVEVVYAGCGPFATLALGVILGDLPVRLTLIDVHERSLEAARALMSALDCSERVSAYCLADATSYVHPEQIDVLIVEAMQRALAHEPQVAITRQLVPQLARDGVLLPDKVEIEIGLGVLHDELDARRRPTTRIALHTATLSIDAELAPVRIELPEDAPAGRYLVLATTIEVFPGYRIDSYESGLTQPMIQHALGQIRPPATIDVRYETGRDPGFRITAVSG